MAALTSCSHGAGLLQPCRLSPLKLKENVQHEVASFISRSGASRLGRHTVRADLNSNHRPVKDWDSSPLFGGPPPQQISSEPEIRSDGLVVEQLVTLETNIDDMSSELIAYTIEQLLRAGALDAWSVSATMKKGRPGHILHALCKTEQADPLMRIILRETTSLGVRVSGCERVSLQRVVENAFTPWGWVPVKAAYMDGALVTMHAEYEDCARLARQHNIPLKVVYDTAHKNFLDSERAEPRPAGRK